MKNDCCAIILAAGKGTRMKSEKPKVLAEILFKPMVGYVVEAVRKAGVEDLCAVTGFMSQQVEEYLDTLGNICYAHQTEQKGTGHAVMMARSFLEEHKGGNVLVICGDTPFMTANTIRHALEQHKSEGNAVTVVTAQVENPSGYGRIVRNAAGISRIVEQKDATVAQLQIQEINSGTYWFNVDALLQMLDQLTNANAQQEYYLTDTVDLALKQGWYVGGYTACTPDIILGANSRKDLNQLSEKMRQKVLDRLFDEGVEIPCTDGILVSPDAKVGPDTVLLPGTILKENVVIGKHCVIGPNSLIQNSTLGDRVTFNASQCYNSVIHSDVGIGPFCHIRPNSEIRSFVHIGDFVEVKNSVVGEGTGISHLTYVGDSDVGQNVNFGCGCVTVNYDGIHKNRCTIGNGAFIGCNTNLVAPVTVGDNAYIGAGSTITDEVPEESLGIARARQVNIEGFAAKKLAGRKLKYHPEEK